MTDPFDALRAGYRRIAPDPAFARRLRDELRLAVLGETGATMTKPVTIEPTATNAGDLVYSALWLPDVARAEAFYRAVLGWDVVREELPNGRQIHGVTPPMGLWGAEPGGTLRLCHAVDDMHAAVATVRAAGGTADEPEHRPYGLFSRCVDNQGMGFALQEAPRASRGPLSRPGQGELLYLTVNVPDSARFRDFYGALFGWTFTPGRVADGWAVHGVTPMTGLRGGAERPVVVPMYGVRDVVAAVAAVRAAGGTATEPEDQPYGTTSDCTDDQGLPFYLGQV